MLSLFFFLLLIWFTLSVLLAGWTVFLQGYIYSEPVEQVFWRAPAAAAVLTLFLGAWALLAYRNPGRLDILTEFSATDEAKPFQELITVVDGKEEVYKRTRTGDGRWQYRHGNRVLPSRPDRVIAVDENGQRTPFAPDRDAEGHYKVEPNRALRYWDGEHKRWMEEGYLGQVEVFRPRWLFANLSLNFLHLAVWFLCLWLLLQFQWSHALGQAFAFWFAAMMLVVPPVLARAAALAAAR